MTSRLRGGELEMWEFHIVSCMATTKIMSDGFSLQDFGGRFCLDVSNDSACWNSFAPKTELLSCHSSGNDDVMMMFLGANLSYHLYEARHENQSYQLSKQ
jgi:hypothetical protein